MIARALTTVLECYGGLRSPADSLGPQRRSFLALQLIAYIVIPLVLTAYVVYLCVHIHALATDFHQEYWPAARLVIHGLSPYAGNWQHISAGVAFPYPAPTALLFVPLALVPHGVADILFTAINIAAVILTLRVLQIRDWRLYGVVFMWPMVVQAWQTANLTLLLGLGIAWLWRERDRPIVAGALAAALISLKPFVWPLAIWLLATRRYAATGWAIATGFAINAFAWALVGFDQVRPYDHIVNAVTRVMDIRGYDLVALAMHWGATHAAAYTIQIAVSAVLAAACVYTGRRSDSQTSLVLCIALSLVATPVLWSHYFALMIIPLALARPRLTGLWFLPLLMWVCPSTHPTLWQLMTALAVSTIAFSVAILRPASASAEQVVTGEADAIRAIGDHGVIPALAIE